MAGETARVRTWMLELIAGGNPHVPPEAISKLRMTEGVLPIVAPLLGLRGVRTIADLLPDDDETTAAMLEAMHGWTGRMLAPPQAPADSVPPDGEPAPRGTLGAGETPTVPDGTHTAD